MLLIYVNGECLIGEIQAALGQCLVDIFVHIKIYSPIIGLSSPHAHGDIHRACAQAAERYKMLGSFKDAAIGSNKLLNHSLSLLVVVAIRDGKLKIDAAKFLARVVVHNAG